MDPRDASVYQPCTCMGPKYSADAPQPLNLLPPLYPLPPGFWEGVQVPHLEEEGKGQDRSVISRHMAVILAFFISRTPTLISIMAKIYRLIGLHDSR